jgi:hypothetical protein
MAINFLVAPNRGPLPKPVVFLAGGITNSPRWQDVAVEYLNRSVEGITICNPRRPRDFEDDDVEYQQQVTWELDHLQAADLVLFWFPAAECRMTRIELGLSLGRGQSAIIGSEPGFISRRYLQILASRLGLALHDRLEDALKAVVTMLVDKKKS